MAQGPSDTILVAIRITLRIRESKVRNPDPPDRRRFVLSEHIFLLLMESAEFSDVENSLFKAEAGANAVNLIQRQGRGHYGNIMDEAEAVSTRQRQ